MKKAIILAVILMPIMSYGQGKWGGKFEQLGTTLPTPNSYRTGAGAPGRDYWQQQADYVIKAELDDTKQSITGEETITYYNNSPDNLEYLWVQLDQNRRAKDSNTPLTNPTSMRDTISGKNLQRTMNDFDFDGGFKIAFVRNAKGKSMPYTINKTMMRIDLAEPMKAGSTLEFSIGWSFNIQDRMKQGGRSGYEYFPKDDNYSYTIAQWFPRMAVYDDIEGWQNKQFLGRGEFALTFGDYKVNLTVPADFIIGATGWLQNAESVLTSSQMSRFKKAQNTYDKPVIIVTQDEAIAAEKSKLTSKKTWLFHADNVRDFAFAASRKYIWDALAVKVGDKTPLAMSYYSKEGNPLWERESTKAVAATLKHYSKMTIDYPYPVAISVHGASIGMEYPMICFNFGRPDEDGTYTDALKWGMIGVIIHEVGHNFFPMIINSDERQWTWMDEGLNTFVQTLTERAYYPTKPARRGRADLIVNYMKGDKLNIRPIMVNSEQILQFGNNAYAKPAAALDILRTTVMGPELFDYAFKTYATRWAFKSPSPADLFRTMEDASAVDLDWFWKGWFYTTDHVDISLDKVKWYTMNLEKKQLENKGKKAKKQKVSGTATKESKPNSFEEVKEKFNFKNTPDRYYGEFKNRVDDEAIKRANFNKNFYELTFKNKGGLVMPIIIEWTFKDGTKEKEYVPAEIWKLNENQVTKVFVKAKEVTNIVIDPDKETADTFLDDNTFPRVESKSKFDKYKGK